ncbi:MAG: GlxA family transcriptional regulator [Pseudomonadota bacterium]
MTRSIDVLLLPDFNSAACHAFLDPLRAANYIDGSRHYSWRFLGTGSEPVRASNGLIVQPEAVFSGDACDWLVVNASWAPERFRHRTLQQRLRRVARSGAAVFALDTGAFVLGWAGLLEGEIACVHPEHAAAFRDTFPHIELRDQLYTQGRGRVCCCGGIAAADLAIEIVKRDVGLPLAEAARRYVFHPGARGGHAPQQSEPSTAVDSNLPPVIRDALVLMSRNLEEPLAMADVAHYVGCSQRQLERLFRRHTGRTPVRHYLELRLQHARALLTQTNRSVSDIASDCGFGRSDAFARAYRRHFNIAPRDDRRLGRVPFEFRR